MSDLEKKLRELGGTQTEYPPELRTATRAEFTTMVRANQGGGGGKKGCCPMPILTIVLPLLALVGILANLAMLLPDPPESGDSDGDLPYEQDDEPDQEEVITEAD